jgi:hypothetical protein
VADARATRGARRWGRDGGAAQGVPPAGKGQPQRRLRATSARPTRSRARGAIA